MVIRIALLFLLALTSFANARSGGGHNTTFDPTSEGGGWYCIRTMGSGTCGGATAGYAGLACDGPASETADHAAYLDFIATGIALNPAVVKLYVPPGSDCWLGSISVNWDGNGTHDAIRNMIIWNYGATLHVPMVGINGQSLYQDSLHTALIQTASAGAQSVVVTTASGFADISAFSVGDRLLVGAIGYQNGSLPPNLRRFEYRLITSIAGSTVGLDNPLHNTYVSTYPSIPDINGLPYQGGAAAIWLMKPIWAGNIKVFGGIITQEDMQNPVISSRTIAMTDVKYTTPGQPGWTMSDTISFAFGSSGTIATSEVDKLVNNLSFYRDHAVGLFMQSMAINHVSVTSSKYRVVIGTGINTSFVDTTITDNFQVGPSGYGAGGETLSVERTTFPSPLQNTVPQVHPSWLTYNNQNNGTFSIANNDDNNESVLNWGSPGAKYFYGAADCTINSVPLTTFTITDASRDMTNTYYMTDLPATLPTPLCNGLSCPAICPYVAQTITQLYSGPDDLTHLAAPP